jgi:hypothetical protein
MNTEPTIICPKSQAGIKLTEPLAAPIVQSVRVAHGKRLAQKDTEIARVLQATVGMCGGLQGIAGTRSKEIDGLDVQVLGPPGTASANGGLV